MTGAAEPPYHTVVFTFDASLIVSRTAYVAAVIASFASGCTALTGADDLLIRSDVAPAEADVADTGTTSASEGGTTPSDGSTPTNPSPPDDGGAPGDSSSVDQDGAQPCTPIKAGPQSPNIATGWPGAEAALTKDDLYTMGSSASGPLGLADFGFTIPSGATIAGIQVDVRRGSTTGARDASIVLSKGTPRKNNSPWPSIPNNATYGGKDDLWGTTWTAEDVNAMTFGVAIAVTGDNALVDSATMTVYYCP